MPGDWLSATEAFDEFHFRPSQLEKWRPTERYPERTCLALNRPVKTKGSSRGLLYWRKDLESIRHARDNPPGRSFKDVAGIEWVARHAARAAPYRFSFQRLMRWHRDGCPFLSVDEVRKLMAQPLPVYKSRGFQTVWYFNAAELATIRANINRGKVISEIHGPGLTHDEAKEAFGVSRSFLEGRGIKHWREARITSHGHITRFRVCSPHEVRKAVATKQEQLTPAERARRDKAAASTIKKLLAKPVPSSEYAEKVAGIGHSCRLRAEKQLGVLRKPTKTPGGTWYTLLPGQTLPTPAGGSAAAQSPPPANGQAEKPKRSRGRQKGWKDEKAAKRRERILKLWDAGTFGSNKAAIAAEVGTHRTTVSKIIKGERGA